MVAETIDIIGRWSWKPARWFTLLAAPALLLVAGVWLVDQTALPPPGDDLIATSRLLAHTEAAYPPDGAERRPLPKDGLLRQFSHGFLWIETGPLTASGDDRVLLVSETRPLSIEAWLANPEPRGRARQLGEVLHREPALALPANLRPGARVLLRIETAYPVELALELDTRTRFERARMLAGVASFVLALALAGLCLTALTQLALQRSLLAALFLGEVLSLCFAVFAVSGYGEYLWARNSPIAQYGSSVAFLVALGSGLAFGSRFLFLELARPRLARVVDGLAAAALALAASPAVGAPVWFIDAAVSAGSFAALPLLTTLPLLRARDGIREGEVLLGAWSFLFAAGSLLGLGRWGLIDPQVPDHFILGAGVGAELFTLSAFMLTRQMHLQSRMRMEASRAEQRLALAHEINNRLGSVRLQARLARHEPSASSPALRERLAAIEHCMTDVALTLDEWRSSSAGDCGVDPLVRVPDLLAWLRRTVAQERPELTHRVDLAGPTLPAIIRKHTLAEIIGNEPPRELRRLFPVRGSSHETTTAVLT